MTDEIKTEIDFHLTTTFNYSHKGESTEATFIRLTAPTSRHSRECAALKQAFFRAVPRNEDAEQPDDLADPEGQDVITMIAMSDRVELPDVLDVARKLFTNGVAMIDGETKLTNPLIDRMSQDDWEAMIGEYMVGFTLASSLRVMKEKLSGGS